jgi:starch synthase
MDAVRVLFASSEVHPYSKTGGLADVAAALPRALAALGHEVLVVSPWYGSLSADPPPLWIGDVEVPFAGGFEPVGVGTLEAMGVRYAFVGHRDFQREDLYGYSDDVRRFSRFTRAIPAVAERLGFRPAVVHANDWHTAYLPLLFDHGWHLPHGFPGLPTVFTVHNVQYQGTSGIEEVLWWLRLPGALADDYLNHFGTANAMQSALGHAGRVTTVSPTYADEIRRPEYGYGLDGTFRHIGDRMVGILNGLDTDAWDPSRDPHLPQAYSAADLHGKVRSGRELRTRLGLAGETPVLGVVSRLADQKGIDVLLAAGDRLVAQGWSLALLGSGDPALERAVRELASRHAGRVRAVVGFDEALAHLVYAGSDALAVPSRFEPCGLSQMIAMRYGTLPIARDTGGLHDTIDDERTGFLFRHADPEGLLWATERALALYGTERWRAMVQRAMALDFSWERSARHYAELYRGVVASAR